MEVADGYGGALQQKVDVPTPGPQCEDSRNCFWLPNLPASSLTSPLPPLSILKATSIPFKNAALTTTFQMLFVLLFLRPCLKPFSFMRYFWRLQLIWISFFSPLSSFFLCSFHCACHLLCAYRFLALGTLCPGNSRKHILDHLIIIRKEEKI